MGKLDVLSFYIVSLILQLRLNLVLFLIFFYAILSLDVLTKLFLSKNSLTTAADQTYPDAN